MSAVSIILLTVGYLRALTIAKFNLYDAQRVYIALLLRALILVATPLTPTRLVDCMISNSFPCCRVRSTETHELCTDGIARVDSS